MDTTIFLVFVLAICIFASSILKAYFQFWYLKRVLPDEYKEFKDFSSFYGPFRVNSIRDYKFALPWFERHPIFEDEISKKLVKKVYSVMILNILFYILFVVVAVYC